MIPFDPTVPHTDECLDNPVSECVCPADDREPMYVLCDEAGLLSTVPVREWEAAQERYAVVTSATGEEVATFDIDGNLTGGNALGSITALGKEVRYWRRAFLLMLAAAVLNGLVNIAFALGWLR